MFRAFLFICLMFGSAAQGNAASGHIATEAARGTVARNMAAAMAQDLNVSEADLYEVFMLTRQEFETLLQRNGFTQGDIATAYGVYFIVMWELANGRKLPVSQEAKVVRYWTQHFDARVLSQLTRQQRDNYYDFLFHAPIILATMHDLAERAGNQILAQAISSQAEEFFIAITKYPASAINIRKDGSMQADQAALEHFMRKGDRDSVARLLQGTRSPAEIETFLNQRNAPKPTSKPQQQYRRKIERNAFRAFPEILLY